MSSEQRAVRLVARRALSASVTEVTFETADAGEFSFAAGQHLALHVPAADETLTSYYSIASPPEGTARFSLCVKTAEGGGAMGEALREMGEGAEATVSGPAGTFRLEDRAGAMVFAAAGTGVSPLRSMILSAASEARSIRLVLGARDRGDLLYGDEWERLSSENGEFAFWPVLSQAANGWAGRAGYVQDHLADAVTERSEPADVYLCGASRMVDECEKRLLASGVDPARIHYEKYG